MGADVAVVGLALVGAAALNLSELQSTTQHGAPPGGGASHNLRQSQTNSDTNNNLDLPYHSLEDKLLIFLRKSTKNAMTNLFEVEIKTYKIQ